MQLQNRARLNTSLSEQNNKADLGTRAAGKLNSAARRKRAPWAGLYRFSIAPGLNTRTRTVRLRLLAERR